MKKIIVVLLVLAVLFIGCNQIPFLKPEPTKTNEKPPNEIYGPETLTEVLAKADNIKNIEYGLTLKSNDELIRTKKTFVKNEKYFIEENSKGKESTKIFDGLNIYIYDKSLGKYVKTSNETESPHHLNKYSEELKRISSTEIGKETIQGFETRVIEFNHQEYQGAEQLKTKAWVSEKYGIIIRIEIEATVIELNNIKFDEINDSVFEVPENKVITMEEYIELLNNPD